MMTATYNVYAWECIELQITVLHALCIRQCINACDVCYTHTYFSIHYFHGDIPQSADWHAALPAVSGSCRDHQWSHYYTAVYRAYRTTLQCLSSYGCAKFCFICPFSSDVHLYISTSLHHCQLGQISIKYFELFSQDKKCLIIYQVQDNYYEYAGIYD